MLMLAEDPVSLPYAVNFDKPELSVINESNALQSTEDALTSRFRNMQEAFRNIDTDKSGSISREEMTEALQKWNIPVTGVLDTLMGAFDKDGSGSIDYREFVNVLARDKHATHSVHEVVNQSQHVMIPDGYDS